MRGCRTWGGRLLQDLFVECFQSGGAPAEGLDLVLDCFGGDGVDDFRSGEAGAEHVRSGS